jgi:thymidylate kinase
MIDIRPTLKDLEARYAALLIRQPTPHATTGDFDIVVSPQDHSAYCRTLVASVAGLGGYVIQSKSNSYMISFTVAFCPDGSTVLAQQAAKIDVFKGLDWNGLGHAMANVEFFEALVDPLANRALLRDVATVVQKITYAGHLDAKTQARLTHDLDVVQGHAAQLLPSICPDDMGRKWALRWRTANQPAILAPFWAFKTLGLAILRKGINPDGAHGMAFQISGMDGSGKSTQTDALNALWAQIPDLRQTHVHLLPDGYPLPHKVLRRKTTQSLYTRPYSEAASSRPGVAWAKLAWYLGLFAMAALQERFWILRGRTVVFDRWFYDFIVDPRRAKIALAYRPAWVFAPRRSNVVRIYLDVTPQEAVDRKGELTLAQATFLSERYLAFASRFACAVIDGGQSTIEVHRVILKHLDAFHRRRLLGEV